jgi:hypothetical protein
MSTAEVPQIEKQKMTARQLWLDHPEKPRVRNLFFQVHVWVRAAVSSTFWPTA